MDANIEVDIKLKEELTGPEVIYIAGNIAPYKRYQLQSMIENDLGSAKEQQIWGS